MKNRSRIKLISAILALGIATMACNLANMSIPVTGLDSLSATQTAIANEIFAGLTLAAPTNVAESPTPTASSTPISTSTASGPPCNAAQFVADVTVPDNTTFSPGAGFVKTWRFKNVGSCSWTTSYQVLFASGDPMGAPPVFNLTSSIPPGATGDLSVSLTAPSSAGTFQDYFKLRAGNGSVFGVGPTFSDPFWTRIKVVIAPPAPTNTHVPATAVPPTSAPPKPPKVLLTLVIPINPALFWTPTPLPVFVLPHLPLLQLPSP
jgi:hypothetical protein